MAKLDVRRLLSVAWTASAPRLPLFFFVAFTVAGAGASWVMHKHPPYSSCAGVVVAATLAPHYVAERVVERLELAGDREFARAGESPFAGAVARVREQVTARRRALSHLSEICFASVDPVKAARIANAFTDAVIDADSEHSQAHAQRAAEWMRQGLEELRGEIQEAEGVVEDARDDIAMHGENEERAAELAEAERSAKAMRNIYDAFARRIDEIGAVGARRIRIVWRAAPPTWPNNPRLIAALGWAFAGAVLAGLAAAGASAWLDASAARPSAARS